MSVFPLFCSFEFADGKGDLVMTIPTLLKHLKRAKQMINAVVIL